MLQEINITSVARQGGRKRFYVKHTRTDLAPIGAGGVVNDAASIGLDPNNPGAVAPEAAALIAQAEATLGQTLVELLDLDPRTGMGSSTHGFGCADECVCVKRKVTLPDGREIDGPAHTASDTLPPRLNAVPGAEQPLAVVERRVQIPRRGLFLLTFEVRLYGSVSRYRGDCT